MKKIVVHMDAKTVRLFMDATDSPAKIKRFQKQFIAAFMKRGKIKPAPKGGCKPGECVSHEVKRLSKIKKSKGE